MKYLQMPVNASKFEKFPIFTPKGHPRLCWFIWIILRFQSNSIENARIDTIDVIDTINMIDKINYNNKYEDNWYNRSDQLTLQTSPT